MILYQEYAPQHALRAYVACLWTCNVRALSAPCSHRVLPDNCIDILWQDQKSASFAVGMMTGAINVSTAGHVDTLAVRFRPGAAAYFFDLPLHELTDQRADLHALWGRDSAEQLAESLWAHSLPDRMRLDKLERHLLCRLFTRQNGRSAGVVEGAITAIERSGGSLRIESLALSLGVSRQQLAKEFRTRVGITPKMFARVCRFQRATQDINIASANQIDWSQLALDHGYFDQSHLIHEFQEFSGSSPDCFAAGLQR